MTEQPRDVPVVIRFFNEIGIIEQLARKRFARVLPRGLTLSRFGVRNHVTRLGHESSPLQLARAFQVTKGAMTNTWKRLEGRGLIRARRRAPLSSSGCAPLSTPRARASASGAPRRLRLDARSPAGQSCPGLGRR